jgi:hypothetical protein
MGEGEGEGEKEGLSPLPSIPSRRGKGRFVERGDVTSWEGGEKERNHHFIYYTLKFYRR